MQRQVVVCIPAGGRANFPGGRLGMDLQIARLAPRDRGAQLGAAEVRIDHRQFETASGLQNRCTVEYSLHTGVVLGLTAAARER